jgi:hypothetical protein
MSDDGILGMRRAIAAGIDRLRADAPARVTFVGLGVLVGTLLGSLHWAGLFVGGAVAGIGQQSTFRGVGAGALCGLVVWVVFLATLGVDAAALPALQSMPIIAVSAAIAVAYGALGGLLRGIG